MTSKEIIKQIIIKLEDELQHYTMVDIDKVKAKYIELEIKDYKQVLQDLERLEMKLHCKNNSIKTLEAFHKSQIENYLQKENKLLDELIICKQQIKILKKALPYYNIKVLCNAGRITEEELEVLLKYEEVK